MRATGSIYFIFLLINCFNVKAQGSFVAFKNEYYGLSDGIQSFLIVEDADLDSSFILIQDTSITSSIKFHIEPVTFSKVFSIISEIKTDTNCIMTGSDSLIVELHQRNDKHVKVIVLCYSRSVDFFLQLHELTKYSTGISTLSQFFNNCALRMKDALYLREINRH